MRGRLLAVLLLAAPAAARAQCPDGTPPPCAGRARAPTPPHSVAVLYFESRSVDSTDRYLADGLTEAIITRLGEQPRLVVKSRYVVRRYQQAAAADPSALARELNVAYIVTGAVQHAGSRLRVTAEMARAASGVRVWGRQYDRGDGDVFAIQEDIARAVAGEVAGRLLPGGQAARPTRNNEAYARLLRGDMLLALRTPASVSRALAEYEAATRLDSTFASAWARIGLAEALRLDWGWGDGTMPPDSFLVNGLAATGRALAIDSLSSDAWLAHGYLMLFAHPRDFADVEAEYRRALALNPRNAEAWQQLGDFQAMLSDATPPGDTARVRLVAAARDAYRHALAIDPGRPLTLRNYATLLPDSARGPYNDSALALDPANYQYHFARALQQLREGDTSGALATAARAEALAPDGARLYAAAIHLDVCHAAGDTATMRRLTYEAAQALEATSRPLHYRAAARVARALADLGEQDRGVAILTRIPRGAVVWSVMGLGYIPKRYLADPRLHRFVEENRPPWAPASRDSTNR